MTILGDRINERLKALGKPQEWLAAKVGMSQQGIGNIIHGDVQRPKRLREIALALETTQEYLLGETSDPTPLPSDEAFFAALSGLPAEDRRMVSDLVFSLARRRQGTRRPASRPTKAPPKRS